MQRVISRVHQIVTSGADATGAQSASASLEGLAAAAAAPAAAAESPPSAQPANARPDPSPTPSATSTSSSFSPPAPPPIAHASRVPAAPSAAVQKEITLAVERLQYATLLGERKKAVASLHDLARSYSMATSDDGERRSKSTPDHVALGLAAIPAVLNALLSDPRDTELMEAMLELLQAFVSTSPATATAMLQSPSTPAAISSNGSLRSAAAAAAATVSVSGTQLCLQLLQDPSPWIRGPTIALVKCMQEAQQKEFAVSVLECKEGLRRLLEVVEDKREHIRDAALQVLVKMTEREKMVQQFLAFEDGFVRLFQIIEVEGFHEGSSVVSDCLQIINNMLRDNLMNQTLFRDLPYLSTHVPQLLSLPSASNGNDEESHDDGSVAPSALKSTQKKRTMKLVLQLVRFLVSDLHDGVPESKLDELAVREKARKHQDITQIQSMITRHSELMGAIGEIVCSGNEELTDLQLQALDMIQLLCSGNGGNQIILVNLQTVPSRRSLLSELVQLDIAQDETPVGAAATNLLDVLFTNNESAKMAIFQHLNAPPPIHDEESADHNGLEAPIPAGRVLLDALIKNAEAVVGNTPNHTKRSVQTSTILSWKACHRFASLIADSAYCKELALRIPSKFDKPDAPVVSGDLFITRCLKLLSASSPKSASRMSAIFQVKIATLTMLIQWCVGCTKAVREVVGSVTTLSILIDTLTSQKGEDEPSDEIVQVRGLTAILLGTCLEYLVAVATSELNGSVKSTHEAPPISTPQLTRHNLVNLISTKIGLEAFANLLVRFQQSPQVIACARTTSKHQRARALLPHRAIMSSAAADDEDADGYLFPLYDRSFTVLCRDLADKIQHRVLSIFTSTGEDEIHTGMGGNNMNAPSAASAYQDLIRMQDKQIQELQRQVSDLSTQLQASTSANEQTTLEFRRQDQPSRQRAEFEAEILQLKSDHEAEKAELAHKVADAMEQSTALESRLQGLSRALEHLEAEHAACGQRIHGTESGDVPSLPAAPTDAMAKVMADLDRENGERRRLEAELRTESQRRYEQEQKAAQDSHAWQIAHLQLQQELENLRTSLAQSEEQFNEQSEMIDVFRQGQESAKRSAAQLKLDLEQANQELEALRGVGGATGSSSPTSKHEAAAKELYQLWEKERAKVRDLKVELERLKLELSTAPSGSPELKAHFANDHVGGRELEELESENAELRAKLKAVEGDKDSQISELNAAMQQQLEEIDQLRNHLKDMQVAAEGAAQRAEANDKVIEELKEELTQAEERANEQRRKNKLTMTELEDEIARMFFEKTETHRKSKASLKQAEQEIARTFLEKVELEKQIAALQGAVAVDGDRSPTDEPQSSPTESKRSGTSTPAQDEVEIDDATAMDDMFIVLASLEIQCNTFRECLEAASGEQGVVEAVQMSRKRGALLL